MTIETQGVAAFRPRARLLKLIGAELISDEVVAITELVKNAHDADAKVVEILFRNVTSPDGEIIIRDDGHGMNLETLLGNWMEPAGTSKAGPQGRYTTSGRRVLGEKGIGRFAVDKLARHLELISRKNGEATEVRAVCDWDQYDTDARMLSEIHNSWEVRPPTAIDAHGTILRMGGLRCAWTDRMFRRLSTRLARLRSPFKTMTSFTIRIETSEFPEYSRELDADYLDRAPYSLESFFDGRETIDMKLNGGASTAHRWNGAEDLTCGPVRVRLFAFDLETDALAKVGPRMEVRAWLKEWCGVSIYRDGFRVWPYGEPHDDWLRLDQRRVNNPVVKLSNNQVVGFVEISRDGNPELADQTNREGLINNRACDDLRRLLHYVMQVIEAERQSVRHPDRAGRQTGVSNHHDDVAPGIASALEKLANEAPEAAGGELRRIASRLNEHRERDRTRIRRLIDGYAELAGLGQLATELSRNLQPVVKHAAERCAGLRKSFVSTDPLAREVRELQASIEAIAERLTLLAPIEESGNKRRRAIDLIDELEAVQTLLDARLANAGVKLAISGDRSSVLRVEMRPEILHAIANILISNSLDWLRGVKEPRIRIAVVGNGENCQLLFSDNGPGIASEMMNKVFEPRCSGKEGGRGMGLTIAKNIIELHGGTIEVLKDARRVGANIRVTLPRKRSRSTPHNA